MAYPSPTESPRAGVLSNQSGIILFMVMGTVALLSIVVTEMAYLSTVSKRIAYDALDQVQAQAMAENGLKISLLRLKAYQSVKKYINAQTAGNAAAASMVPQGMIEQIWSFPFAYPIPKNLPGMSLGDKEAIEKFEKASTLEGSFVSVIQSESARMNLNLLLSQFAPSPTPSPTAGAGGTPSTPTPTPTPTPFDAQAARESLFNYLQQILLQKMENDADFAADYRDFKLDEFVDALAGWADRSYQPRVRLNPDEPPLKRAPFYSLSELRMLPSGSGFDDTLFDLFAPGLTVATTNGINVNSMGETTVRALVPRMTVDESKNFFKFRDDPQADNRFKDKAGFLQWIQSNVAAFRNDSAEVQRFDADLTKRGIRLITEETQFRIFSSSEVNRAKKSLEAWVTLTPPATNRTAPPPNPGLPGAIAPPQDPGIRITFMRIL